MEDMKGFMKNAHGGYDPISAIKPIDLARDDLVKEIVKKSEEMSAKVLDMKRGFFNDIKAFLDLSAEKYDVRLGGKKRQLDARQLRRKLQGACRRQREHSV